MEEVGALINDHHASTTVQHQPLLPAFTPINRASPSPAHIGTVSAPVPAQPANKGKKRQRKLSAPSPATPKPTKATRPRLARKAKEAAVPQTRHISHAFNLPKPLNQALAVPQRNDHVSSLGNIPEASHQASKSCAPLLHEPVCESSLQTCPQRPSLGVLESSYQAAFEQAQQHSGIDGRRLGHLQPSHVDDDNKISGSTDTSLFHPASPSHSLASKQHEPIEETSSGLVGVKTVSEAIVLGSICQVPCSSGIMFPVTGHEVLSPRPAKVSKTLPHGEKYLPQPELDDWDMMIPQTNELPADPAEAQSVNNIDENRHDQATLRPNQTDAVDSSNLDDFFCTQVEDDCLSMYCLNKSGQILMSESNEHDLVPATAPGSYVDSDILSCSSGAEIMLSRADNNLVSLSSSQPLLESSSPCRQFHPDQQPVSDNGSLSKDFTPDKQATDDDLYDDEEVEIGFLDFQSPTSAQAPPPSPPESPDQERRSKPEWMIPHPITPDASPVRTVAPWTLQKPSLTSASALIKRIPRNKDVPHLVSFDQKGAAIPFIRPPFPNTIRDRSPVLGFSSDILLRTCFRIGEALNAGSLALRTRTDAVIELYARVTYSERLTGTVKQHFHFADIFSPDKPPFLKGTYGVWKGCDLWDSDSKVFLGEKGKGKMARVIGRIGREEKTRGLEMMVLSVWEADWEDVGICKGHYCG
ncbi:MAG: hypothetical protein Q9182_005419 [Xanthomendoza sp. 2 TL-2023]